MEASISNITNWEAIVSHFNIPAISSQVFSMIQEAIATTTVAGTIHSKELERTPVVKSVMNIKPIIAVYVHGALGLVWTTFAFLVWYRLNDTIIDTYSFYAHAGAYGQLFIFWILAMAAQKSKGMRLTFLISTCISLVLPFGGLYGLAAWYIYDSFAVPYDENNNPY